MTEPSRIRSTIDIAAIEAMASPIAHRHGGEIFEIEWTGDRSGPVLRVTVEKLGSVEKRLSTEESAVDLEVCSHIARDLSPALDVWNGIPHTYRLEVSSPGIERPLRHRADFERFQGAKARIRLRTPVADQKIWTGRIGACTEEGFSLEKEDGTICSALWSQFASGNLLFELRPSTRSGGASQPIRNRHLSNKTIKR